MLDLHQNNSHSNMNNSMKKSLLLLSAGLLVAGTIACTKESTAPRLRGSNLPQSLEGQYATLIAKGGERIDSAQVTSGAFEFDLPDTTSVARYDVELGGQAIGYFPESGTSTIIPDSDSEGYTYDETSTPMNRQLATLTEEYNTAYGDYVRESLSLQEAYKAAGNKVTPEISKKGAELSDRFTARVAEIARKCFEENKNNELGRMALSLYPTSDSKGFVELYESAGDLVKQDPDLKKLYELQQAEQKTSAGQPYVDVTMTDETGKEIRVSELREEGKHLLVDVWASWCGPCRAAMPHLAEIAKGHPSTIKVVSIGGINETYEANTKAREELGMTWTTVFDTTTAFADAYGIQAIPTLILINPEGTIELKTNDANEMSAKIADLGL